MAHEVTAAWAPAQVQDGGDVDYDSDAIDDWDLHPLDYQRLGGKIRLEITPLVDKWTSNPTTNLGVVIITDDIAGGTISNQVNNARLTVRYRFYTEN